MRLIRLAGGPKFELKYDVSLIGSGFKIKGCVSGNTLSATKSLTICLEETSTDFYYVEKGPVLRQVATRQVCQYPTICHETSNELVRRFEVVISNPSICNKHVQRTHRLKLVSIIHGKQYTQIEKIYLEKVVPPEVVTKAFKWKCHQLHLLLVRQLYIQSDYVINFGFLKDTKARIILIETYDVRLESSTSNKSHQIVSEHILFHGNVRKAVSIDKYRFACLSVTSKTNNISHEFRLKILLEGIAIFVGLQVVNAQSPPPTYYEQLPSYSAECLPCYDSIIEL